jgi:hypothetical protein
MFIVYTSKKLGQTQELMIKYLTKKTDALKGKIKNTWFKHLIPSMTTTKYLLSTKIKIFT